MIILIDFLTQNLIHHTFYQKLFCCLTYLIQFEVLI